MTPIEFAYYFGILIGCLFLTLVPYARKKYDGTVEQFNIEYAVTMLIAFCVSVFASLFIFEGTPVSSVDPFYAFIDGVKLGLFDNFWVNEVKKVLEQ